MSATANPGDLTHADLNRIFQALCQEVRRQHDVGSTWIDADTFKCTVDLRDKFARLAAQTDHHHPLFTREGNQDHG